MDDRGQALPLVLMVVALTAVAVMAVGEVGSRLVQYQRARAGADAAALAVLVGGAGEAARLCRLHGCVVLAVGLGAGEVTVRVRVGSATAEATAAWSPVP